MYINVVLESDFRDYYDHMFDTIGVKFERMSVTDLSRSEAFTKMTNMGLAVPAWGSVQSLYDILPAEMTIVVYIDEYAHRGEGKLLMGVEHAMDYSGKTASIYVPNLEGASTMSLRYLRIGKRTFWLLYHSLDEWRSNYGDVNIVDGAPPTYLKNFKDEEPVPMLAIDFTKCLYGGWLAIDYNTSPGLRGTPVENVMDAKQVVDNIKEWCFNNRDGLERSRS